MNHGDLNKLYESISSIMEDDTDIDRNVAQSTSLKNACEYVCNTITGLTKVKFLALPVTNSGDKDGMFFINAEKFGLSIAVDTGKGMIYNVKMVNQGTNIKFDDQHVIDGVNASNLVYKIVAAAISFKQISFVRYIEPYYTLVNFINNIASGLVDVSAVRAINTLISSKDSTVRQIDNMKMGNDYESEYGDQDNSTEKRVDPNDIDQKVVDILSSSEEANYASPEAEWEALGFGKDEIAALMKSREDRVGANMLNNIVLNAAKALHIEFTANQKKLLAFLFANSRANTNTLEKETLDLQSTINKLNRSRTKDYRTDDNYAKRDREYSNLESTLKQYLLAALQFSGVEDYKAKQDAMVFHYTADGANINTVPEKILNIIKNGGSSDFIGTDDGAPVKNKGISKSEIPGAKPVEMPVAKAPSDDDTGGLNAKAVQAIREIGDPDVKAYITKIYTLCVQGRLLNDGDTAEKRAKLVALLAAKPALSLRMWSNKFDSDTTQKIIKSLIDDVRWK